MTDEDIFGRIERLHTTLARWEDGACFKVQRVGRSEDGGLYDGTPDDPKTFWIAEVYENGLDSPAETGEGPTAWQALENLLLKSEEGARVRIASVEAVLRKRERP